MPSTPAVAVPLLAAQRRQIQRNDELITRGDLNVEQTSLEIGQSIPIVFGKRTDGAGGVWLSPPAAECRFENDTANRVTASYLLVLADGQLGTIAAADAYQGDSPLLAGQIAQAYNARAAAWAPGNFIQQRFNVTTTSRRELVQGKQIGVGELLDLASMDADALALHIDEQVGSLAIKSAGNYVTSFEITVTKSVDWPADGFTDVYKGPSVAVSGESGPSGSDFVFGTPEFYDRLPWQYANGAEVGPAADANAYSPTIQKYAYSGQWLWFRAANQWVRDRGQDGRYMATAQYEVTRTASTEPYGDIEFNLTETIRGGFLLYETASIAVTDGTYYASILGGLPPVSYDVLIEETNSEPLPKPEATLYCGTGGSYSSLSTFSIVRQYPAGDDGWKRQAHLFVREGEAVTRLIEGTAGASNLFPDLARELLLASARMPAALIDDAALLAAARFCSTNLITFDGVVANPSNVREYLDRVAPLNLLRVTNRWGKIGLRPALPVTAAHAFELGTLTPVATFDESNMLPATFSYEYVRASDRKAFAALVLWREQPEADIGVMRATEVRYTGTATDGPFEEYDGSDFITRELHAIRAGALELARRKHITHRGSFDVAPTAAVAALRSGDIIRVNRARTPSIGSSTIWSYLYEIETITGPPLGPWKIEITHHPVDPEGRSLLARDVAAAVVA